MVKTVEIPEGYQDTEIGIIPCDWKITLIKNIAEITTGAKNTQDKIDDGQYPFFVRSQKVERINSYSYDGEAVLTAGDGVGTGKVIHYINGKFDFHQRVYKICSFNENLNGFFFYLYFSKFFLARIMSMTAKSSVDSVRMDMIANMPIPLPPKPEQTAIANALSDADALIENLEKLISKKRNIKQGVMQTLLTDKKRLAEFKRGWVIKKLGEIAEVVMGQSPKSEFYNSRGIGLPLVQGNADVENRKTIIHTFTSEITKKGKKGAIIMSVRAPVGEISKATFDCCLGRGVCAISYKNDYLSHYLIYFEKSWARLSTGSTFDSVNSAQVRNLEIPIPTDEDEQTAIATVLNDMDFEIEALVQKLHKYKMIKQGMMQVLLTGKIRLI
jgi:type I restriction enzyme, S subunit